MSLIWKISEQCIVTKVSAFSCLQCVHWVAPYMWCCWLCSAATWWLLFSRMKRFKSVWDTGSAVADWYFLLPGIVKKCRKNPSTTAYPLHLGSTGLALWIQIPATADFEKQQQVQTSSLPCTEVQLPKNKRALVIALFDQMLCNHTAQNLSQQGRLDLRQYYGRFDLFSAITHTQTVASGSLLCFQINEKSVWRSRLGE